MYASIAWGVSAFPAGRVYFDQAVSRAVIEVEVNDALFEFEGPMNSVEGIGECPEYRGTRWLKGDRHSMRLSIRCKGRLDAEE